MLGRENAMFRGPTWRLDAMARSYDAMFVLLDVVPVMKDMDDLWSDPGNTDRVVLTEAPGLGMVR